MVATAQVDAVSLQKAVDGGLVAELDRIARGRPPSKYRTLASI